MASRFHPRILNCAKTAALERRPPARRVPNQPQTPCWKPALHPQISRALPLPTPPANSGFTTVTASNCSTPLTRRFFKHLVCVVPIILRLRCRGWRGRRSRAGMAGGGVHDDSRVVVIMGGTFLKQSVRLPGYGYGIEHEKFFCESKCESGLQNGPAPAKAARPSNRCGQELAATGMRRLVEISGGDKAPARFRAKPSQHRHPARGSAAGKCAGVVPDMGREVALASHAHHYFKRLCKSFAFNSVPDVG